MPDDLSLGTHALIFIAVHGFLLPYYRYRLLLLVGVALDLVSMKFNYTIPFTFISGLII